MSCRRDRLDHVSPSRRAAVRQRTAHEVNTARLRPGVPKTVVQAEHYLISPAFDAPRSIPTLDGASACGKENPPWRLSVQQAQALAVCVSGEGLVSRPDTSPTRRQGATQAVTRSKCLIPERRPGAKLLFSPVTQATP